MSGRAPSPPPSPANDARELCLITGASGFIGGHLAARLAGEGVPVRCLVRPTSDTAALATLGVQLAVGDLADPRSLRAAAAGAGSVLHCAALVSDWATEREILRANVEGTSNLLAAAAGAGVRRFVHLSSTDVYGHPGGAAIEEGRAASAFANWYAHSKRLAEAEVRRLGNARGVDCAILRPATVYGPGSRAAIGEIGRAILARHMLLVDRGRAIAGLCYVDNLADAALLALAHPAAPGEAFNVTDGLPVTWRRFVDDLARGLGCPPVRWSVPYGLAHVLASALEHGYRFARRHTGVCLPALLSRQAVQVLGVDQDFSNAKARELLGWAPRVGYEEGLQATLAWLRAATAR